MRIRSTNNSKKVFYKGISLEDYIRKQNNLFDYEQNEQTLIMDQFNQPLLNNEDYEYSLPLKTIYAKKETDQLETKDSTTIGVDQDQFLPSLQFQKTNKILKKNTICELNFSRSLKMSNKKTNICQFPLIEASKSKNMRQQRLSNMQMIRKRNQGRLRCMASRQVSQQSQDEHQIYKKGHKRILSYKQQNEHIKKDVSPKRHASVNKSGVIVIKAKVNSLAKWLCKQEK